MILICWIITQKKCTEMIDYIKSGRDVYIRVERNVIETKSGEIRLEEISRVCETFSVHGKSPVAC